MLTIFTIPKPFHGHIATIQRNAIRSWSLLQPSCEIILFGDDEGTAEIAAEFGLRYIPNVVRNEYGTPLVNDLFEQAQSLTTHDLLCYVNADIVLMSDFMRAAKQVASWRNRFLMVGHRWDVDIEGTLDFALQWEDQLRTYVNQHGQLHSVKGMDYFLFPRGFWRKIPPFAIGRTAWDNWFLYQARAQRDCLIDATQVVMAIHQNHNYAHIPKDEEGMRKGLESKRNFALLGGRLSSFNLCDATHILTPVGPKRALDYKHLGRYLVTLPVFYLWVFRWPMYLLLKTIKHSLSSLHIRLRLILHSGGFSQK